MTDAARDTPCASNDRPTQRNDPNSLLHGLAIVVGILLTPLHVPEVRLSLRTGNRHVMDPLQATVCCPMILLEPVAGHLVVVQGGAVANVATARVQQAPDLLVGRVVVDDFQKVVAAPERPELVRDLFVPELRLQVFGGLDLGRDAIQDLFRTFQHGAMLTKARGDAFFEFLLNERLLRVGQIAAKQVVNRNGRHAASNVDPHRVGTDVVGAGKDGANRDAFLRERKMELRYHVRDIYNILQLQPAKDN